MPWVRLDDGFHSHPKALAVGLDGCGLFARALSYCGAYLTDGRVPHAWVMAQTAGDGALAIRLEEAGLWQSTADGDFVIPDFTDLNPTKAAYVAEQAAGAARAKASRDRRRKGPKS